ncbi:uncharacterized protein LOC122503308 [Leptopilina heterotoma]|uniref:uncharacterized protein LOC122503308 n=1 Tax=Leptopilina heterotoma TaxID=63436 RepID=UPI001CA967F0|nr:uncharacterized protein LOC122503308 [Leptopilina heterotoma]
MISLKCVLLLIFFATDLAIGMRGSSIRNEEKEGAWGGASSADSSALDERVQPRSHLLSQIQGARLTPRRGQLLADIQATKLKPISYRARRVHKLEPKDSLMDELSLKLAQRAARQRERSLNRRHENE